MLSQDYITKFEERLGQLKTASGANRFMGFLKPFGNKGHFDRFSKQLNKEQPWLRKANVSATDVMQHMDDERPIRSFVNHFKKVGPKSTESYGNLYAKDFAKKYPKQFAEAQKKVQTSQTLKHVALGGAGVGIGGALLKGSKTPSDNSY